MFNFNPSLLINNVFTPTGDYKQELLIFPNAYRAEVTDSSAN